MMLCHSSHLVHIRRFFPLLPGECANIAVATSCKTHHTHSQKCGLLLMQAGGAASAVRRHSGVVAASSHCSAGRRRNRDSLPRSCLEAFLPTAAATVRRARRAPWQTPRGGGGGGGGKHTKQNLQWALPSMPTASCTVRCSV